MPNPLYQRLQEQLDTHCPPAKFSRIPSAVRELAGGHSYISQLVSQGASPEEMKTAVGLMIRLKEVVWNVRMAVRGEEPDTLIYTLHEFISDTHAAAAEFLRKNNIMEEQALEELSAIGAARDGILKEFTPLFTKLQLPEIKDEEWES